MSSLGELLKERRQERRWTLDDVAQRTRITPRYLEAIEEGNYDLLPADVQVRGFLRNYALVLGLDPKEVLALYQEERGEPRLASIAPISRPPRTGSFVLPSPVFAIIAFVFLTACGSLIYFGWVSPAAPSPTPTTRYVTPTNILPTPTPTTQLLLKTPTPTGPPVPTAGRYEGLEAVLKVSAACWVRVVADGAEVYEGTLRAGAERTFRAERELRIRMGNAGGLRIVLNGEDLGVQGASGQVVDRTWRAGQ